MKRLITYVIAIGLVGASASLLAMGPGPGGGNGDCHGMGKYRGERFEQMLNLSDQQKAEIQQIREDYRTQLHAARVNSPRPALRGLDPTDPSYTEQVDEMAKTRATMAEHEFRLRAEKHAKIYAVLDEEQRAQLNQIREDRKNQRAMRDNLMN